MIEFRGEKKGFNNLRQTPGRGAETAASENMNILMELRGWAPWEGNLSALEETRANMFSSAKNGDTVPCFLELLGGG